MNGLEMNIIFNVIIYIMMSEHQLATVLKREHQFN